MKMSGAVFTVVFAFMFFVCGNLSLAREARQEVDHRKQERFSPDCLIVRLHSGSRQETITFHNIATNKISWTAIGASGRLIGNGTFDAKSNFLKSVFKQIQKANESSTAKLQRSDALIFVSQGKANSFRLKSQILSVAFEDKVLKPVLDQMRNRLGKADMLLGLQKFKIENVEVGKPKTNSKGSESRGSLPPNKRKEDANQAKDSPELAYKSVRLAFESGDWEAAIVRFSPANMKEYVAWMFLAAGESGDRTLSKFEAIQKKHAIEESKIFEILKRKSKESGRESTFDDFVDEVLASSGDINSFLSESLTLIMPKRPHFKEQLRDIKIDGNRAQGIATHVYYTWSSDSKGTARRNENPYDERVYFRKYKGKWKICVKGEWENPKFKLRIR